MHLFLLIVRNNSGTCPFLSYHQGNIKEEMGCIYEVTKYVTTWFSREKPMLATCT